MLTRDRLLAVAGSAGVAPEVIEKDYALSWILWALFRRTSLRESLVFKGGTCLRKCYIEDYRFSEDLDFTAVAELDVESCLAEIAAACAEIAETTNLDFEVERLSLRALVNAGGETNLQGQIFYSGPRKSSHARIKLDISLNESLAAGAEPRELLHVYDDAAEVATVVPCYSLNEIFAEKMRALLQRNRARDLYDVWWLLGHRAHELDARATLEIFRAKASSKEIPFESLNELVSQEKFASLEDHWDAQIGHQLPSAPQLADVRHAIQLLLVDFITAGTAAPPVEAAALRRAVAGGVPTFAGRRSTIVRAARERRVLRLRYSGKWRHVDPYEFVFGKQGDEQLFGFEHEGRRLKRYRVHAIEGLEITAHGFVPRYPVLIG